MLIPGPVEKHKPDHPNIDKTYIVDGVALTVLGFDAGYVCEACADRPHRDSCGGRLTQKKEHSGTAIKCSKEPNTTTHSQNVQQGAPRRHPQQEDAPPRRGSEAAPWPAEPPPGPAPWRPVPPGPAAWRPEPLPWPPPEAGAASRRAPSAAPEPLGQRLRKLKSPPGERPDDGQRQRRLLDKAQQVMHIAETHVGRYTHTRTTES